MEYANIALMEKVGAPELMIIGVYPRGEIVKNGDECGVVLPASNGETRYRVVEQEFLGIESAALKMMLLLNGQKAPYKIVRCYVEQPVDWSPEEEERTFPKDCGGTEND